jgi:thioredoxin reductase (NADPH)
MESIENVVIIGSGPAGHTAAIYASRAQLNPILFEGVMAGGVAAGGQLTTTTDVENFPGFPSGISGPELMVLMREQSINNGCRIETKTVDGVDFSTFPYKVFVEGVAIDTRSIIISTGATAKRLGVDGELQLWQKGISACAVCDGGLPIFRNQPLVVVGGGDSACEEAHYLTKFASHVYMMVRKDHLRASKVMQSRVLSHDKITVMWNTQLKSVHGEQVLESVSYLDLVTNQTHQLAVKGLFYAIGHTPNTDFLGGQLDLRDDGYIITAPGSTKTSVPGVFAAGDVQDKVYRQAITSAGTGCMAALDVEHYLNAMANA